MSVECECICPEKLCEFTMDTQKNMDVDSEVESLITIKQSIESNISMKLKQLVDREEGQQIDLDDFCDRKTSFKCVIPPESPSSSSSSPPEILYGLPNIFGNLFDTRILDESIGASLAVLMHNTIVHRNHFPLQNHKEAQQDEVYLENSDLDDENVFDWVVTHITENIPGLDTITKGMKIQTPSTKGSRISALLFTFEYACDKLYGHEGGSDRNGLNLNTKEYELARYIFYICIMLLNFRMLSGKLISDRVRVHTSITSTLISHAVECHYNTLDYIADPSIQKPHFNNKRDKKPIPGTDMFISSIPFTPSKFVFYDLASWTFNTKPREPLVDPMDYFIWDNDKLKNSSTTTTTEEDYHTTPQYHYNIYKNTSNPVSKSYLMSDDSRMIAFRALVRKIQLIPDELKRTETRVKLLDLMKFFTSIYFDYFLSLRVSRFKTIPRLYENQDITHWNLIITKMDHSPVLASIVSMIPPNGSGTLCYRSMLIQCSMIAFNLFSLVHTSIPISYELLGLDDHKPLSHIFLYKTKYADPDKVGYHTLTPPPYNVKFRSRDHQRSNYWAWNPIYPEKTERFFFYTRPENKLVLYPENQLPRIIQTNFLRSVKLWYQGIFRSKNNNSK